MHGWSEAHTSREQVYPFFGRFFAADFFVATFFVAVFFLAGTAADFFVVLTAPGLRKMWSHPSENLTVDPV